MKNGFYEQEADNLDHFYFNHGYYNYSPAHFHNSIEILFVASGRFIVRGNGEERILTAGDAFFADAFVTHLYKSEKDSEFYVIVMSENYLKNFRYLYRGKSFPMFMTDHKDKLTQVVKAIGEVYAQWNDYNALMKRGFADWLLGKLSSIFPPEIVKVHKEDRFIAEVLRYIDENFANEITLTFIANRFGYSPNYFSSLFKRYTDMSLPCYVNRVRIGKAEAMLRADARLSVSSAAFNSGFHSLNTYYRALKDYKKEERE